MSDFDEGLYEVALEAIKVLFSYQGVSKRECADNLMALRDEIDVMIESLGLDA